MPMSSKEIEDLIVKAFPDAIVKIDDLRGDGDHYAAHIVTKRIGKQKKVKQHQMVYNALGGRMGNELHALALNTSAPMKGELTNG